MSRGVISSPVVTQVTTTKIANPQTVTTINQPFEVLAHQFSGTPTATPSQPPS